MPSILLRREVRQQACGHSNEVGRAMRVSRCDEWPDAAKRSWRGVGVEVGENRAALLMLAHYGAGGEVARLLYCLYQE